MNKEIELVRDEKYPTMWRLKFDDGELSDMYNQTRAREHKRRLEETAERKERLDPI